MSSEAFANASRALACVVMFFAAGPSLAASFVDEADWQNAASGFAIEDFESASIHSAVTSLPSLGVKLDPFGLGPPQVDSGHLGGSVFQSGTQGMYNSVNDVTSLGPFVIRPVDSGQGIVALGAWNVGTDDTLVFSFYDSLGDLIEEVESPNTGNRIHFAGIVSTTPAARVEISPGVGNGYIGIDDLQVVISVPALSPVGMAALVGSFLVSSLVLNRERH